MYEDDGHVSRLPYRDLTEYAEEEINGDKPTTSNKQNRHTTKI
jgi:hypothetical protein